MSRTEAGLPDAQGHRRRTTRQVRHEAKATLHEAVLDDEVLADADALCPKEAHDLGRHASGAPPKNPKEGRRGGFKVWKTRYWKRRRAQRAQRNQAVRDLG